MIFGVDVSNHQTHFDFAAARAEGYDFAFIKSTQGDYFTDDRYAQHLANARNAGMLVAAYHYQWDQSATAQVNLIRRVVATDTPVILDVEEGSGGVSITRELVRQLTDLGYHVPLSYIPRWYWSGHIGSPDLSGLPPLWVSRYPDYTVRRRDAAYSAAVQLTGGNLYAGYGGLPAVVAQISASGAVADYPNGNIDLNVYAGSRDQLAALLGATELDTRSKDMGLVGLVIGNQRDDLYAIFLEPDGFAKLWIRDNEQATMLRKLGVPQSADRVRQGWVDPLRDWQDTAAGKAFAKVDGVATAQVNLASSQEALHHALTEVQVSLLAAIREIPAGPSGEIDYDLVEARIRKVFGDAAAGPATA